MDIRTVEDIPLAVKLDDSGVRIYENVAISGPPGEWIELSITNAILLRDTPVHLLGGQTLPTVERRLRAIPAEAGGHQ